MQNRLTVINYKDWTHLRDLYANNWPENILPYFLIQNYINWRQKDVDYVTENVQVYSLNENWSNGTFMLVDQCYLFFYTLDKDLSDLKQLLHLLDKSKMYVARCVYGKHSAVVKQVIQEFKLHKYYENYCYMFHFPRNVALLIDNTPPDGIMIRPLEQNEVNLINSIYPLRDHSTAELFKRLIKYNPNLGAFDEHNGDLLAWCVQFLSGELSALQVKKDSDKRQGLATLLLMEMSSRVAADGFDIFGIISTKNQAPLEITQKYSEAGVKYVTNMYHVVFGPKGMGCSKL